MAAALAEVLRALRPPAASATFDDVMRDVSGRFGEVKARTATAIATLLSDRAFLDAQGRLAGIYVLFKWFEEPRSSPSSHPHFAIIHRAARGTDRAEAALAVALLSGQPLGGSAIKTFAASASMPSVLPEQVEVHLKSFEALMSSPSAKGLFPLLVDHDPLAPPLSEEEVVAAVQSLPTTGATFQIPWVRHPPPFLELREHDIRWVDLPFVKPEIEWDYTMLMSESKGIEVLGLIKRAFYAPLSPHEQQQVQVELEADPSLAGLCGLTPKMFPALVENNPLVAIDLLLKLATSGPITEYLNALLEMEISLHSMEVVNRLSTACDLPKEFVQLYITNCIRACESIKDKVLQTRLVRLICVFLQALIRNRILDISALMIEIQTFCIEFSRVREAAALFRLLKTFEGQNIPEAV